MLYIVVLLSILSTLTWIKYWSMVKIKGKVILLSIIATNVLLVLFQYVKLHPYEYIYFNELIGYLPGAKDYFETDYWGASYIEAASWINENVDSDTTLIIGICGNEISKKYFNKTLYRIIWLPGCEGLMNVELDYIIANGRNNEWNKIDAREVYQVKRMNIPLVKIFKKDKLINP